MGPPADLRPLLTVTEAAAILRLSVRTVRSMIAQGSIPVVRLSVRRLAIRPLDLESWIARRTQDRVRGGLN